MKSKKMKLLLGFGAISLLAIGTATTLFLTLNKTSTNVNNDTSLIDDNVPKPSNNNNNTIAQAIKKLKSRPLKLNETGKNTLLSEVNTKNIISLFDNFNAIKVPNLETKIINLQKNHNDNSLKFDVHFVSGQAFDTVTDQIVTGFKKVDNTDTTQTNQDEQLVDETIHNILDSNMSINFLGKKITAKKVYSDFKVKSTLIQQYVINFPTPKNGVQINYDLVSWDVYGALKIKFFVTSGDITKDQIYTLNSFGLNHEDIVNKAIKELESKPLTINEQGKQTKLSQVNEKNIANLVNNYPQNKQNFFNIEVARIEKAGPNAIKVIFKYQSNRFIDLATQIVEGFIADISNVLPSYKPITIPALPSEDKKVVGMKKEQVESDGLDLKQNGLKDSLNRLSTAINNNKKINVYYAIGASGDSQKFGLIAHLVELVQLASNNSNPINIQLFLDKNNDFLNESNFNFTGLQNVNVHFVYSNNLLTNVNEQIKKDGNKDSENYLFIDDITTLDTFRINLKNDSIQKVDFVIDNVLPLLNMQEINIVSFGNESTSQFSDELYKYYKNSPYLQFDLDYNKFSNAHTLLQEVTDNYRNGSVDYIKQWLNTDRSRVNYLISSIISANDDNLVKTRYLVDTTKIIYDVNNTESTILLENDNDNIFFNPYNVEGLGLIDFFSQMSSNSKTQFNKVMKFNNIDFDILNNASTSTNYVYNMNYINFNDGHITSLLQDESNKIIKIYDLLNSNSSQTEDFTIWVKVDDKDDINKVKEEIKKAVPLVVWNKMQFLDHKIPMEYYVANNLLSTTGNKTSTLCVGYDHVALSLAGSSKAHEINYSVLLTPSYYEGGDANVRYGVTNGLTNASLTYSKDHVIIVR